MSALADGLRRALEAAGLRPIDIALADWGARHGGGRGGVLGLALASHAVGQGHSNLRLDDRATRPHGGEPLMDAGEFADAVASDPLASTPGAPTAPLVLDGERLYLQRYWEYERRLAQRLRELLAPPPTAVTTTALEPAAGRFTNAGLGPDEVNWQAVAAFVARRHRLAVISGGPGTGKTYTVVRLLLCEIEDALAAGKRPPAIRLAAPTGKAAARMLASLEQGVTELDPPAEVREWLPQQASTLHQLLRMRWNSTRPGHDREQPLPADLVIVDETSMVDLPMMTKLAEALPEEGRLVLLGDRYQLASVESGAVLADLCVPAGVNAFSAEQRSAAGPLLAAAPAAEPASTLADHVVTLQTSHRFRADSGIGRLAQAINGGHAEGLGKALAAGEDIRVLGEPNEPVLRDLIHELADAYAALHEADDPGTALHALAAVRVLTATRIGPLGSEALNRRIAAALAGRYGFDPDARQYHARPLIVTRNDYRARLHNGDIGVIWGDASGSVRACFQSEAGLRQLPLSALPEHETVYAMTVHKSQGSEFDTVYLLPAPADSPVLTRELLYTGVTRARERLIIAGASETLAAAIARRAQRTSGLAERIVAG